MNISKFGVVLCLFPFGCVNTQDYGNSKSQMDVFKDTISSGYSKNEFEKLKPVWIHLNWNNGYEVGKDTTWYTLNVDSVHSYKKFIPFYKAEFVNGRFSRIIEAIED